jgi:hemerythrin superfamily protein
MDHRPLTTMSTTDVVELLLADHKKAKALLARFEDTAPTDRTGYFCEVVTELVRHEVAEEHVVYPIMRHAAGGEHEADVRISEQAAVEKLLAAMEKLDSTSPEFASSFATLQAAVLDHAAAEEATTFPRLQEMEDAESRVALGGLYELAKSRAPTHPHPHAPHTPPGNLLVGPVAALFDRARDAVRGA